METPENSTAFHRLHEKIQRWVWEQGWTELRDAQEAAIPPILEGNTDVIIAAATASGKTEAAFLPICSKLLTSSTNEANVIYISPLKALINDQFRRTEQLCEQLDISVYPWHGDITSSRKKGFIKKPQGILLITPESLESLLVNHGHAIPHIFKSLAYIVIDELHSFIGAERGRQLQSLTHRIEFSIKRKVPRIGLSATIGDMHLAAEFLRPGAGDEVTLIVSDSAGQEVRLLLRGFLQRSPSPSQNTVGVAEELTEEPNLRDEVDGNVLEICSSLFQTLRGDSHLVFANSRAKVELFADLLRRMCEEQHLPNEFWPHHGSLSKELREDAETAIKEKSRPVSIICTSTLEMGIDIGSVNSIAQIGVPPSVASMRQRLGRSGRRGSPAVLRVYLQEDEITPKTPPTDALRASLVQTIAMVRLLLSKWYEPPPAKGLHLSTLVQQILSLTAQYGGVTAMQAWQVLCKDGPFGLVDQTMFIELLRSMGQHELIMQSSDGLLLHGKLGEKIVNHYSFYTAFMTQEEYRLVSGERTLGTLPIDRPLSVGSFLIFGGRRWLVLSVDALKKIIELKPSRAGKPPSFGGQAGWIHDRIRKEMFRIYTGDDMPIFLDSRAKELLIEARENFRRYGLENKYILPYGNTSLFFCWRGDRVMDTLTVLLRNRGIKAENEGIAISALETSPSELEQHLRCLADEGPVDEVLLAKSISNKIREKYDPYLSDGLLCSDYAVSRLDTEGAWQVLTHILKSN